MLLIFGLVPQNLYQLFIMIHMKISMELYVVENILHSIHQQIFIGWIKNFIKKLITNVIILHRKPPMKMAFI